MTADTSFIKENFTAFRENNREESSPSFLHLTSAASKADIPLSLKWK